MTGVRVPRSELLNARSWAMVKLIGFIVACLVVAGLLLLGGAMLVGARINFHTPTVVVPAPPAAPAPMLVPPPPAPPAPATAPQIVPALAPPALIAPAPDAPEELERAFKGKLLAEGENP